MNYEEEQRNELEALSEIYFNEINIISSNQPISFSIKVRPQASNYDENNQQNNNNDSDGESNNDYDDSDEDDDYNSDNDDDDDDDDHDEEDEGDHDNNQQQGVYVELKFDLPQKYPDEKPSIQVLNSHNLTQEDLATLMQILCQKAEENLGTVMVFMLVSDVVEWLISKTAHIEAEHDLEHSIKQKELETEERKRFEGTPVTEATFMAWKAKFDAEMLRLKFEQKVLVSQGDGDRLTGRAMFESDGTLAESDLNFVEDLDQGQIEALLHNIDDDFN